MHGKAEDDDVVMGLVERALAVAPEERERYLRNACGGDTELFRQVWKYVQWEDGLKGFLLDPLHSSSADERPFEPGQLLDGRSRVVRETLRGSHENSRKGEASGVRRSAPWWIWVVAASFLFNFALIIYLDFTGPILGMHAVFTRGYMLVNGFDFPSPAADAGLSAGDHILQANGRPITSYGVWWAVLFNLKVGEPVTFEIQRNTEYLSLSVIPERRSFLQYPFSPLLSLLRFGQLVTLGLACFVAFARPRNGVALIAALFFAGLSGFNAPESAAGLYTLLRALPAVPFALINIAWLLGGLTAPLLFTFFAKFPRPLIRASWLWVLIWAPYVLLLVTFEGFAHQLIFDPRHEISLFFQRFYTLLNMSIALYFVAGVGALVVNYGRLTDISERRRVRLLVFGSVAGLLAIAPPMLVFGQSTLRGTLFETIFLSWPVLFISVVLCFLVFPLSFVYSILCRRLFDVRIIIRQGIQYAMARGVLLSVIPLLAVTLLADIILHGNQSLAVIVRSRGWIYGLFGALAAMVYQKRQGWLDQIDRRFFRDRFDAQRLLQDVIQRVRNAKDLRVVSRNVVVRIQNAFHSEFVCLLHRSADQTSFQTMACEPVSHRLPPLPAEGVLVRLLRVMEKPLQCLSSEWVINRLPLEEVQLIEQQHIDLLVPIATGADAAESMLVLGPKRSEEPYGREDEKLLTAISSSLALLSREAGRQTLDTESFQECPSCGACFNSAESTCNQDGSSLVGIPMSRLLADRYRLDRRIGFGGMGTVYAGTDEALERAVAVKVIRPELVQRAHVNAKFHQEARAAAGLVHRNVITVHDFGIERQHPFIVMELLTGQTLRAELDRAKPLSAERTLEILDGVCAAIEEAHRRQLLHRDIKPENIFLAQTPTGELVKVLDFGLVKALVPSASPDRATAATSVIAGTPYYMAPEQLLGEPVSPSADVWALGVIAYEMLVGAHPFVTGTPTNWHDGILKRVFTAMHVRGENFPPAFQAFFERVFQPDPKRRIDSAGMFLAELRLALRSHNQTETKSTTV